MCVRRYSSYRFTNEEQPSNGDINPDCPHYLTKDQCKYEKHTVLLSGGEHTFSDSEFIRCHHLKCGGAIDHTEGGTLIIKRCLFDRCSCTDRGGAVSFRGVGTCIQEDNLYTQCVSTNCSGAFSSFDPPNRVIHNHQRCRYVNSRAEHYAHICFEYSPDALIESNIFIQGTSTKDLAWASGTVVNYQEQGPIVYSNCLFSHGKAVRSGGLVFLGEQVPQTSTLTVKFCFFINNFDTNNGANEIYFDSNTGNKAHEELIIQSFSATPNSRVFVATYYPQQQDWLPLIT